MGAHGCHKEVSSPLLPRDTSNCELLGMCSGDQISDIYKDSNDSKLLSHPFHLASKFSDFPFQPGTGIGGSMECRNDRLVSIFVSEYIYLS